MSVEAEGEARGPETPAPAAQDLNSLEAALEQEKGKAQQYLANWQRAQADFINYRRRAEEERNDLARGSIARVALTLLPVLDDLERALATVPMSLDGFTWVDGIRLIYRKLQAVLEAHGVTPIEALGQGFDPRFHEAVMYGEGEEGQVVAELQKGYKFPDRVLRPTLVVVGRAGEKSAETASESEEGSHA